MPDTLERFSDLERRYDGPIPPAALATLRHGSYHNALVCEAAGMVAFFERMARGQVHDVIRPRKVTGSYRPYMRGDLHLYLRERRKWRNRLEGLQQ